MPPMHLKCTPTPLVTQQQSPSLALNARNFQTMEACNPFFIPAQTERREPERHDEVRRILSAKPVSTLAAPFAGPGRETLYARLSFRMRIALYLRRSTNEEQADSLEIQEEILRRYATEHWQAISRRVRLFATLPTKR